MVLPGPGGAVKAATAIRVDQFLAQLRHAVGIKQSDPNGSA
jgi:hypothetical protein